MWVPSQVFKNKPLMQVVKAFCDKLGNIEPIELSECCETYTDLCQKFHEDSTMVYSIEEDDHDMLTMTAMIGAARIIFTQF